MTIPSDKIAVVTGDPRSGTSLMMQTMNLLGVPIAGEKFPGTERLERQHRSRTNKANADLAAGRITNEEHVEALSNLERDKQKKEEKSKEMNPGGFYEIPGVVMRGLKSAGECCGKVVKIVSPGAYPQEGQRFGTPSEIVYKYILCLRNPKSVAQSQKNINSFDPAIVGEEEIEWNINPTRYLFENGGLAKYLSELTDPSAWEVIDYDEFVKDPKTTIEKIVEHLEISPSEEQITSAIANVTPKLNRSEELFPGWGDQELRGVMCEDLYDALKKEDYASIKSLSQQIEGEQTKEKLETSRWYDEETGLITSATWCRQADIDPEIRITRRLQFIKEIKRGLHPCTSPDYEESEVETYTIERPVDLGPLVRTLVKYQGKVVTREEALTLHQRLWNLGKAKKDKELVTKLLEKI